MDVSFGVSVCYADESDFRPFAEGCDLDTLSSMCASACRLAEVKYIRIDEFNSIKPFKRFTL